MTHPNYRLKKLGKNFKLQKEFLKTEMNHDEITGDNYKDKKDILVDHVKNDVLSTALSYARYTKAMEEITGFGLKDCLSLPRLGWKNFKSLRTEENEPIYTYNDKCMRWSVPQSIKGGRVCAFSQYYKSEKICDDILKIISENLNIRGNIYDITEAYLNDKNKRFNTHEKEYENQYKDYRDENVEEKGKFVSEILNQLPIHQILKQMKLDDILWDSDAVSLYPSAMWDENSIYPRIETGYA